MNQLPYYREQAAKLLETGSCDLPLVYEDVARRVAANPMFASALQKAMNNNSRMLEMITITAANVLCKEQDQ